MSTQQLDLLKENITPAHEEASVRSYQCTYYHSRLLGLEATGYLGITNKRVIFQASGTSNAGPSVIQSEVPIDDVSGISSYKGTYFSIGQLFAALVVSVIAGGILSLLLTGLTSLFRDHDMITAWIIAIGTGGYSLFLERKLIWRPVLATISAFGFAMIGSGSVLLSSMSYLFSGGGGGSSFIPLLLAPIVGIYALVCYFWYARRPTFTLAIHSKGGSSTPISISGASGIGIFDVAAGRALNAEPAQDAGPMLQELGAIILDIQKMGDFGIEKWQR